MEMNSNSLAIKKRKLYSKEHLVTAIHQVKNNISTIYTASKQYKIPKSTLRFHLTERTVNKVGPKQVLSVKSELKISEWVIDCASKGDPRTKEDVLQAAAQFDAFENKPIKFGTNGPSNIWLQGFLKRHPNLSFRKPEAIGKASATVSKQDIDNFFNTFNAYIRKNGLEKLFDRPDAWYNLDETSFDLNDNPDRVLAARGSKSVYKVNGTGLHDNITTTFCFSAAGDVLPPQIIFNKSFSRIEDVSYAAGETGKKFFFARSEKGWQTQDSFKSYVERLDAELCSHGVERPIVLLLDGHASHKSIDLYLWCKSREIILLLLPPNTTHILQMCDTSVFGPTKRAWRVEINKYKREKLKTNVDQTDFIKILSRVMDKVMIPETIKNGFKGTGMFPFNRHNVHDDRIIGVHPSNNTSLSSTNDSKTSDLSFENLFINDLNHGIISYHHDAFLDIDSSTAQTFQSVQASPSVQISSNDAINQDSQILKTFNGFSSISLNEKLIINDIREKNKKLYEILKQTNSPFLINSLIIQQQLDLMDAHFQNISQCANIEAKEPVLAAPAQFF
ncbi:hypothetical protein PVAND_000222 [Polypedilum vanderplanki]|uniref:HTH CENPB-type domain-containing protein n=1 Tax=Polypedilum vanderplanki TaxID=319348 RepID=A0A9J6BJF0_POLVA|nr:hypothetical protein PVAND_000222 [Polypedilum vanderplanki]